MTFKRAIVTAVGPLRIMIDGDTEPIPFTPESLIDPATLAVDDVVRAELSGNRLVVLGRVGGTQGVPFARAAGTVSIPFRSVDTYITITVTLPVGRFTQAPIVTGTAGSGRIGVGIYGETTTQFFFEAINVSDGAAGANTGKWVATQMTSGSAAG